MLMKFKLTYKLTIYYNFISFDYGLLTVILLMIIKL